MGIRQEVQANYNLTVGGSGVRIRRYPALAAATVLTGDGAKWVWPVGANVKAFFAAGAIVTNWRYFGIEPYVPSADATEYNILLGASTAAGGILTLATALMEVALGVITFATGQFGPVYFPYAPTVVSDGVNDAGVAGLCTTNAVANTLSCGALVAIGFGT